MQVDRVVQLDGRQLGTRVVVEVDLTAGAAGDARLAHLTGVGEGIAVDELELLVAAPIRSASSRRPIRSLSSREKSRMSVARLAVRRRAEDEAVRGGAADQDVAASAGVQPIGSRATVEEVAPGAPVEPILAAEAQQGLPLAVALEALAVLGADRRVVRLLQLERADVGIGIAWGRRGSPRWSVVMEDAFALPSAGFVAASSRATVSVGPPLAASTPPATPVPAIGAVAANTDWAAMFSRSPAMLPLTSLPNRLWPLLSVTAPLMSE